MHNFIVPLKRIYMFKFTLGQETILYWTLNYFCTSNILMLYFFWQLAPKGGASIVRQNLHINYRTNFCWDSH